MNFSILRVLVPALAAIAGWMLASAFGGADLMRDLAADLGNATGIDIPAPASLDAGWSAACALAAAWMAWLGLELSRFWQALLFLLAASVLVLTGVWTGAFAGIAVPAVPVLFALAGGLLFSQFFAGFAGTPEQQEAWRLLGGQCSPATRAHAASDYSWLSGRDAPDAVWIAIEGPPEDSAFMDVVLAGLREKGALVPPAGFSVTRHAVFGLWADADLQALENEVAVILESLRARPGNWRVATARGHARVALDAGKRLLVEGQALREVTRLLAALPVDGESVSRLGLSLAPTSRPAQVAPDTVSEAATEPAPPLPEADLSALASQSMTVHDEDLDDVADAVKTVNDVSEVNTVHDVIDLIDGVDVNEAGTLPPPAAETSEDLPQAESQDDFMSGQQKWLAPAPAAEPDEPPPPQATEPEAPALPDPAPPSPPPAEAHPNGSEPEGFLVESEAIEQSILSEPALAASTDPPSGHAPAPVNLPPKTLPRARLVLRRKDADSARPS